MFGRMCLGWFGARPSRRGRFSGPHPHAFHDGGGGGGGADPARVAALEAEVRRLKDERQADIDRAKESEQRKLQKALDAEKEARAKAEKERDEHKDALQKEKDARAAERKRNLIWDRLRSGEVKDGDGDDAKAVQIHDDRDLLDLLKVDGIELDKDGKLPADFDAKAREWAKSKPHAFKVGDGDSKPPDPKPGTGGGQPPGTSRPRPEDAGTEGERLRARAKADFAALHPPSPFQQAAQAGNQGSAQ